MGARNGIEAARGLFLAVALCSILAACSPNYGEDAAAARNLAGIYDAMRELAASYPGFASVETIGYGASSAYPEGDLDLPILELEIKSSGAASGTGSGRTVAAQIVAALHGDEEIGAELALDIARRLCAGSGSGGIEDLVLASTSLSILPVANPWGYGMTRRMNASSIDLNRNFPWAWGYEAWEGLAPLDAPEAAALARDARAKRYALSIALHSGASRICVSWDYIGTSSPSSSEYPYTRGEYLDRYSPAHELFVGRASAYAALVEAAEGGGPGSFPVVQGYDWYFAGGSLADWLYGEMGCAAYTVEISLLKAWKARPASERERVLASHGDALMGLLAAAGRGARGTVIDASGAAVAARVSALPRDSSARAMPAPIPYEAFAFSGGGDGAFLVPLPAGEWLLSASSLEGGLAGSAIVLVGAEGYSETAAIVVR